MSATAVRPSGEGSPAVSTASEIHKSLAEHIAAQSAEFHAHLTAAQAARTAAVAGGAAVQLSPIDADKFAESLQSIQNHYSSGAGAIGERAVETSQESGEKFKVSEHLYKLAPALAYHVVGPGNAIGAKVVPGKAPVGAAPVQTHPSAAGDKAVDALLTHIHGECLNVVKESAQALLSASEEAEKTKAQTAQWLKQMNALRERDKTAAHAKLDALYAKAAAIGREHPNHRAQVLHITNHGSNLLTGIYAGLAAAGFKIERDVKGAIHAVWPSAKVAQTVASWAVGAVKSVGAVFAKLF